MGYASIQYHSPELPFSSKLSASYGNKKTDGQSGNTQGPAFLKFSVCRYLHTA
jgi:hypothetical protein